MKKLIERYADFVAKKPHVILIVVVILTLISFVGMSLVKTEGMSYKDMLPENVEEIDAINYIADEFGTSGESAIIILRTNPNYVGSNEIRDIRDPRVVEYSDILEQKIRGMEDVVSVTGFSDILKTMNSGHLPKTKAKIIELMNKKIVINQSSFNLPEVLSQFSEGLEGIEEGMKGEEQIIEGLTYGLNGSSIALKQIQYTLSAIAEGMNQEQDLSKMTQIISSINQIESLVNQSNATLSEKMEIIGYLEVLKQGMNTMIVQTTEAQEGMQQLSISLNGMSNALENISSGLEKMKNTSLILGNFTSNLRTGISEMSSGLDEINRYIELYEGKQKKEKPISLNQFKYYVSKDYTTTIIRINLGEMNDEKRKNFVEELKYIIDETEKPAGLNVGITGGPVVSIELRKQIMPTMQKTSMFSLIGIFIIVSLLFLSIRRGIISLLAIGFGIIWVYGTLGILGLPISSTMSGGISMIMGIGIDFGIQVVNRFRQERKKNKVEKAIKITFSNVFTPMLITTLAALIGFRAMSLGQLTLLSDLGNMMSLGVLFCFIAAVTVIPAILVISEKLQYRRKI
ncbi:MAG: MMPL family transporter [Candidatus Aenigmarchaeota archaeon]|nr:MMPL family transporter [Candidatus Aenigmarchaeota archaeon]